MKAVNSCLPSSAAQIAIHMSISRQNTVLFKVPSDAAVAPAWTVHTGISPLYTQPQYTPSVHRIIAQPDSVKTCVSVHARISMACFREMSHKRQA